MMVKRGGKPNQGVSSGNQKSLVFRTTGGQLVIRVAKSLFVSYHFLIRKKPKTQNIQSHRAANVEVSLSQIQCGNLTA